MKEKLKKLVKKGGVADIVTLVIIVGLVIALLIAVVLPLIDDATTAGTDNEAVISGLNTTTDEIAEIGSDKLENFSYAAE